MKIHQIGVLGAGTMGTDLAFDLASNGFRVLLKDIDANTLKNAERKMRSDFRGLQMIKKELKTVSLESVFGNIKFTTAYEGFNEVDLVVENIPENWELKKQVYIELGKVCKSNTYYGVNTSCISITRIAALLPDPSLVIGMHFMNPVPLKHTVETIRGEHTSDETVDIVKQFLRSFNKTAIVVNDFPGFVANRLSHLFMNEAAFLVQDQVALPKEIDTLFRQGYGHQMGPLETADLIGLDTVVNSLKYLYEYYQDPKFRCCPLLQRMVDAGFRGKKSGRGFYVYD
jgi:3-hydroxybutyryl-CoA dehydrogenase